ncbi:VapC toxin family PIN domain ribonuclease [Streptomyces sp. HNA39]|uniref:VapC toxin family PIN domain ribonuclease n=1 Tax=Streptomyces sp. HNA39 TaxID=2850561 RepID=UPI00200C4EA9|nr:VapC toxin family PIN domain ribonuclease [Streptomyces sp. HNA39]UQA34584.1 VapC toxin family PIN domain ribonuclease [Streptomyces sp. HNA39]
MSLVAVADTNALYRLLDRRLSGHEAHREGLAAISHLVISPFVLAEPDYLITTKAGARQALTAARFIERNVATRRFEIPPVGPHLSAAIAAAHRTEVIFTSDRRFRMVRPLTGHKAFRLLPDDL